MLAGGAGSRLGGEKALVELAGRPLIAYPLSAARGAGLDAVVVAKTDTPLPRLEVARLIEPGQPRHPLCGIVAVLREHRNVIAVPCDMPFLTSELLRFFAARTAETVVGELGGRIQPFPALYRAGALPTLETALVAQASLRTTLADLEPELIKERTLASFGEPAKLYLTVNTPADLEAARRLTAEG